MADNEPSNSDIPEPNVSRTRSVPAPVDTSRPSHSRPRSIQFDSLDPATPALTPGSSIPSTPNLSTGPFSNDADEVDALPPLDRLSVFDFIENLALPQRFEKLQTSLAAHREKVYRQQQKLKETSQQARGKVVDEWRRRVPSHDEQLQKYRKRMRTSVDRLSTRWNSSKTVTMREKISFVSSILNVFVSGYLVGAFPEYFHWWYTAQLSFFYPVRFYLYRKKGYHYFLADLCYYVNLLLLLSIWAFPSSKRLFISTFCLGFGNNAVAIAMWRNSFVFHSFDKVTSLFIHIMPCVTLHCIVHLVPEELRRSRFPAVHNIKTSSRESPIHYGLGSMALWSTVPYALWQIAYHFLVTRRNKEKIAAGRPTSFTWLRKSYSDTWIGKVVLARPEYLQEPCFMLIQYLYALLTMLPAPIWFWFRWPSAGFLMLVFFWSVYNGANYYIDVFGTRFQKELEQLKKDVANWQTSPELMPRTPNSPSPPSTSSQNQAGDFSLGAPAVSGNNTSDLVKQNSRTSDTSTSTGAKFATEGDGLSKRTAG